MSGAKLIGICQNPHSEQMWFPADSTDEKCPMECDCQPVFYRLASEVERCQVEALGWLSAELAHRADAWNGNAPDWFPEPPEWLELWDRGLEIAAEEPIREAQR